MANLQPLDILRSAAERRESRIRAAFELVAPEPLRNNGMCEAVTCANPCHRLLRAERMLRSSLPIVSAHRQVWSIRDWPFRNFWWNPPEPAHSKLLAYLLDPTESHGCGQRLLRGFYRHVLKCNAPSSDSYSVTCEEARIDVLVRYTDRQTAVIVENKVNGAIDQDGQLDSYVNYVRQSDVTHIHVVYLPLRPGRHIPDASLSVAKGPDVTCHEVSYAGEVADWLRSEIDQGDLPVGLGDVLRHYCELIAYLSRVDEERKMDEEIMAKLREARQAGTCPTWHDLDDLQAGVDALRRSFQKLVLDEVMQKAVKEVSTVSQLAFVPYATAIDEYGYELVIPEAGWVRVVLGVSEDWGWYVALRDIAEAPRDGVFSQFSKAISKEYQSRYGFEYAPDPGWFGYRYLSKFQCAEEHRQNHVREATEALRGVVAKLREHITALAGQASRNPAKYPAGSAPASK